MYQPHNVELAVRIGLRTALVAQCLWDLYEQRCPSETDLFDERRWLETFRSDAVRRWALSPQRQPTR